MVRKIREQKKNKKVKKSFMDLSDHTTEFLVGLAVAIFVLIGEGLKILMTPLVGEFIGIVLAVIMLFCVFIWVGRKKRKKL